MIQRKPKESLNDFLKRLREHRGITQAAWGKAAGVDQSQVWRWENGKGEPGVDNLRGISGLTGLSVAALIGDKAPEFAPPREMKPEEKALAVLEAFKLPETKLEIIRAILLSEEGEIIGVRAAADTLIKRLDQGKFLNTGSLKKGG